MIVRARWTLSALVWLMALAAMPARAGQIGLAWNAVSGASGYHVYYGTQSGVYGNYVTTTTPSVSITVQDCQTYYVAVKAFNAAGESQSFSNEISGWAHPTISSTSSSDGMKTMQGGQTVIDVYGSNFQPGASIDLGPNIEITSASTLSCTHSQFLVTVEPTARGVQAAQVGKHDLVVYNPGPSGQQPIGTRLQAYEVLVNPARYDINQSDSATRNRVDGKDVIYLARVFNLAQGNANYDPNSDIDGNGLVDGTDLAYIASSAVFGRCWDTSSGSWTVAACPANLQ